MLRRHNVLVGSEAAQAPCLLDWIPENFAFYDRNRFHPFASIVNRYAGLGLRVYIGFIGFIGVDSYANVRHSRL